MPQLFEYLVRLSGTLMVMYLFYWLVLSRLTFYNSNRWYLLGCSIAAFFIPLINISPVLEQVQLSNHEAILWIPVVQANGSATESEAKYDISTWNMILLFLSAGIVFMSVRFIVQFFSLRSIRTASKLISDGDVKLYHTDRNIIPFSFGNAIFINQQNHSEEELRDIIHHEFIHVKQKHTIDILWSEWLCILNWYNPFAWLIRHAMRQNLEFIADYKVVQSGVDKKQYQYLLLKVIGVPEYNIATSFNFTSLKKRIAMMNKFQSARLHFLKFLFIVPLFVTMLLAFRNHSDLNTAKADAFTATAVRADGDVNNSKQVDTIPEPPEPPAAPAPPNVVKPNNKGYAITIADNYGECIVIVKDKHNKIVKAVSLQDWDKNKKQYQEQYGMVPPAPAPGPSPRPVTRVTVQAPPVPPAPELLPMPDNVAEVHVINKLVTITLKNGDKEKYDLSDPQHKSVFEKKYGTRSPSRANPRAFIDSVTVVGVPDQKHGTIQPDTHKGNTISFDSTRQQYEPLILVDGKEVTYKAFNLLDRNQIESIDVLKDETAKQLYGEKGKHGVVKITTRRNK